MCGISAFRKEPSGFMDEGRSIRYRGPDVTKYVSVASGSGSVAGLLFHRLSIIGLDSSSDQPF